MLGILLAGLPGCGQSPNNKETSSSESSAADEPESEIIYINGVLTESDEDSVMMEYGSEGNFTQTTFDISNADIQIGESRKQGGPLAANLKLEIGYYVKDGKYIAVSVYGDGSESMTPSWIYNHEQQTMKGKTEEKTDIKKELLHMQRLLLRNRKSDTCKSGKSVTACNSVSR